MRVREKVIFKSGSAKALTQLFISDTQAAVFAQSQLVYGCVTVCTDTNFIKVLNASQPVSKSIVHRLSVMSF